MTLPRVRPWQIGVVLIFALAALLGWSTHSYLSKRTIFQYRLTVEIEADGQVHTGSSIIEIRYFTGIDRERRWIGYTRGVAPFVELGRHGTIIAALEANPVWYRTKMESLGLKVSGAGVELPKSASLLPLGGYNVYPKDLGKAKGKVVLKDLPSFVWIRRGADWLTAEPVLPQEMPVKIDPSVRLVQVTIEPAPDARLITRIKTPPPWLVQMRRAYETINTVPADQFQLSPRRHVERD